ncbi:NAD-dependent epimerase/dehydratase [Bradyrhizobium sp. STM 3843]|uniref:NAD-dependent epimerase/dehydratase family protein n=1 Tax=Bradyrhizobium sp. STM 3843 TaxID=551947 RepID=UPI00024030B4|nr:NAD-dependent epimerase/dehydratase family protein [Bradyrhizobium sp. STM 3843]CCE10039.1 NAD-dependent epimerase/dehydratase [Bradyrhizobium sp. STM 3843]
MDGNIKQPRSLVIGGTGLVGGYLLDHLVRRGERPLILTRSQPPRTDVDTIAGDLQHQETLRLPAFSTLYCTAHATLLGPALVHLVPSELKRLIVLSSTSLLTKLDSEIASERAGLRNLIEAEREIMTICEQHNIAWTILRPTLIYSEGRDRNITPLSRLIRRFHVMPLVGGGQGARQPVHAEDLAIGAIAAAAAPAAANKIYAVPGGETLAYREMIGRIFDGLGLPRHTPSVPAPLWRALFPLIKPLFPGANVAMGLRMMQDMAFDAGPAMRDFGWSARGFRPLFA